jgi:hypothetical protein
MAVYNPNGGGNVHIDKILTNISVGWPNNGFVGEQLFPTVQVNKQSDLYYVYGREAWLPERGDERAPGTEANEIPGMQVSTNPYYAKEHALQIAVTDEERENADSPLAPDRDATELITAKIMLGRELIFRNLTVTAANYATGNSVTLAGVDRWDSGDAAGSHPIQDVRAGITAIHSKMFLRPNVAVIPWPVLNSIQDHSDFLNRIMYAERAIFSEELFSSILGIEKIIVPGVGYNTAVNYGAAETLGYVWTDDVILAYVPPRPGLKTPAFGYEFRWGPQFVDRWREEKRASDLIRVRRRYDTKMIALDGSGKEVAGYLIKDTLASI